VATFLNSPAVAKSELETFFDVEPVTGVVSQSHLRLGSYGQVSIPFCGYLCFIRLFQIMSRNLSVLHATTCGVHVSWPRSVRACLNTTLMFVPVHRVDSYQHQLTPADTIFQSRLYEVLVSCLFVTDKLTICRVENL
jgi:hypothetical protein